MTGPRKNAIANVTGPTFPPAIHPRRRKDVSHAIRTYLNGTCGTFFARINEILEFPQFYPQTSDFAPFIIHNFMKMPKI